MPVFRTKEDVFNRCTAVGFILLQDHINIDKIKANLKIAGEDIATGEDAIKKKRWNSGYKSYYDALHGLIEAFLVFDKVKSKNHQCLFSYVCVKYPELELDWNFFEKIRTKRNGINYYGTPVEKSDWDETNILMMLYIKLFQDKIKEKLDLF